jgi:hypothetical protein
VFVIHSTHYISKANLCQRNNDAQHVSEVLNNLYKEIKTDNSVNFTELKKMKSKYKIYQRILSHIYKMFCVAKLLKIDMMQKKKKVYSSIAYDIHGDELKP